MIFVTMKPRTFLLCFLFCLCFTESRAQSDAGDLRLLQAQVLPEYEAGYNGRIDSVNNRNLLQPRKKNAWARYNPARLLLTGAMAVYQQVISPQISAECLYERTCSNFSKAAIGQLGLIRGLLLTADRLSRCSTTVLPEVPSSRTDGNNHIVDEPSLYGR